MKKHTIMLTIGILVSKLFGIFREMALAATYNTSVVADVYKVANDLPTVIYGFVAAGIVTTFIPIYSKISVKEGDEQANKFLSNVLNILFVVSALLSVLGFIFAEELIRVYASGFVKNPATFQMATSFLRISIFSILFLSSKSILEGFLQIKKRFLTTVVSGITMNLIVISSFAISFYLKKPIIMAYSILIAVAFQTLIMIIISIRAGYRHQKVFAPKDANVIDMLKMAGPIIIGSSIDQINRAIDTSIASGIQEGAISTLSYAVRISDSILGIFVSSISAVMYPSLARQASEGKISEMKSTVQKIMNTVNILIIPATFGLMILAVPVVSTLFRTLNPSQVSLTASAMAMYTVGTVGYGLRQILVRTFYSLHDSVTPVISGVLAIVINVILNLILPKFMGVPGLALATSISALVAVVFLYAALRRKIGSLGTKNFLITTLKIVFSSTLMGIVVFGIDRFVISGIVGMVVSIGLGVIVYVISMYFMKIDEADDIFKMILKKVMPSK